MEPNRPDELFLIPFGFPCERTKMTSASNVRRKGAAPRATATEPAIEITVIQPAMAAKLLETRPEHLRINDAAVEDYAVAMRQGRWKVNGKSILLDPDGRPFSGIQRLAACVRADTPFVTFLVRDVDPTMVATTLDQHRRRSYRDVLRARGEVHEAALEGALIWLMRYKDGDMTKRAVPCPWTRLDRLLAKNPDLREIVAASVTRRKCLLNEAIRTPLAYMGSRKHPGAARKLLDQLTDPDAYDVGEPGVVFAGILEHERRREDRVPRFAKFAYAIQALNDLVRGTKSRTYNWTEFKRNSDKPEPFPIVLGYKPDDVEEQRSSAIRAAPDALELLKQSQSGRDIKYRIEVISPAAAEKYLLQNRNNRKTVDTHVDSLARDIAAGVFVLNYDAIAFGKDGRLLDGQHRLKACVRANSPIESLVLEGLDESAYDTYDIQAKKGVSVRDLVDGRAVDQAQVKAAAVLVWKDAHKNLPFGSKPTPAEIREIILANPKLVELRGFGDANRKLGPPAVLTFLAFKYTREAPRIAARFLRQLEHPEEIEAGSPVLALRARLIKLRENRDRPVDRYTVMAIIDRAWVRFRAHRRGE